MINRRVLDPLDEDLRKRRVETFAAAYLAQAAKNPGRVGKVNHTALEHACKAIGQKPEDAIGRPRMSLGPHTVRLGDGDVKQAMAAVVARLGVKYARTAQDTLEEIAIVGHSDIRNYFDEDEKGGIHLKRLHGMGKESRAIKTIKHKHHIFHHKAADTTEEVHEYEYEFWDKLTALRILAEYHKIINSPAHNQDNSRERVIVILPSNGFEGQVPKSADFEEVVGRKGPAILVEPPDPMEVKVGTG